ncbi:hypothetical protein PG995_015280 [Apiospora arundinis]
MAGQRPLASPVVALAAADRPEKFKPAVLKVKVKTRGKATENQGPAAADEKPKQEEEKGEEEKVVVVEAEEEEREQVLPPFFTGKVDDRAASVFDALFHKRGAPHGRPGEVKWVDFLHAMTVVGFRGEKMIGSVWQFAPAEGRTIQFHEPHPTGKIPFRVARAMGRRLRKHYNWGVLA